jgi:hypothetical protein
MIATLSPVDTCAWVPHFYDEMIDPMKNVRPAQAASKSAPPNDIR